MTHMGFRGIIPDPLMVLVAQPMDGDGVVLRDCQGRFVGFLGHSPIILAAAFQQGLNAFYGGKDWMLALHPSLTPDQLPIIGTPSGWRKIDARRWSI